MTALSGRAAAHVVIALACFESPAKVAADVKVKFGVQLSRQRIEAYHPERLAGTKLSAKWRAMFYETRARLLAELDDIPIACQSYRLKVLDRMAQQAENLGNLALAMELIEQAAREVGGMYERRQASPSTSTPIAPPAPAPDCQL